MKEQYLASSLYAAVALAFLIYMNHANGNVYGTTFAFVALTSAWLSAYLGEGVKEYPRLYPYSLSCLLWSLICAVASFVALCV